MEKYTKIKYNKCQMRYERERSIVAEAQMLHQNPQRLGEIACETDIDYENDNPELRALRREFYILLSVGISDAVDTFIGQSQSIEPLGLIRPFSLANAVITEPDLTVKPRDITEAYIPYAVLADNMRSTVDGLAILRESKHTQVNPHMAKILERIDEIGPRLSQSLSPDDSRLGVRNFAESQIRVGMVTFTDKVPQFLRAIELGAIKQHGPGVTLEEISKIANASNLHQRVAAMGIDEFMLWSIRFPSTGNFAFSFDDYFIVHTGADGEARVNFARELPPEPEGIVSYGEITERFNHKIGCPAMIRLVDDSSLQEMWDWSTGIAEQTVWQRR